jgi:putative restriction endonuclease
MALTDISDSNAVRAAVEECKKLGEDDFLKRYGFGRAHSYFLIVDGERYPSKAVLGVAHGIQFPDAGQLKSIEFTGGEATVRKKLNALGFTVEVDDELSREMAARQAQLAWFHDRSGKTVPWPRAETEGMQLATLAKGIYKPAGSSFALSVRIVLDGPYPDAPELRSDGGWTVHYHEERQSGGTEPFGNIGLMRCLKEGAPIGVMQQVKGKPGVRYRILGLGLVTAKAHGFFVIEGPVGLDAENDDLQQRGTLVEVDKHSRNDRSVDLFADMRKRLMCEIVRRQGQGRFRRELMRAYDGKCAITNCDVEEVLEAAHIAPYLGAHSNHVSNGLLLRADLHTLFDLGHLQIDPEDFTINLRKELRSSPYANFHSAKIRIPKSELDHPSAEALRLRQMKK